MQLDLMAAMIWLGMGKTHNNEWTKVNRNQAMRKTLNKSGNNNTD
jgi:hypothetical protein